ncbi:WD repeat-containing protein 48-like isoform X2 [Hibiscus syriacus]|uniref:WD repeat-containing protein 48-like isoform X2 n=1 Tax=Hibiscus syriacus TaxID=106335 RepID=UPI0019235B4E|nr:WD repeat-containing protein 48-like isoform X2 [Hibiscus syriacus]
MHRVGSVGNNTNSNRLRKEKRLTYVLNDSADTKHCAGINCLALLKSSTYDGFDYLFTGSRDGTLKRWALGENTATCSATFESHVDWVNDTVIAGDSTLVSCSSDTTLKTWNCLSYGTSTRTFRQHSDYVTCLANAEKNANVVASGGLGGEVFVWDIEAAITPVSKSSDVVENDCSNGINGSKNSLQMSSLRTIGSSNGIGTHTTQCHGYVPIAAKGHKESVYALAMNHNGSLLVSGGTEKVVRVWDPRTGSKNMKLRGHTDNIRALLMDSTGRYCLSGSSDSMIRLWDLGQQRCVHSYAVHTDSVWALASTPTFSHVYSGGRDLSLYLTDLSTRESLLLCIKEQPILQLALHDDNIWVATTDSSVSRWPAEGRNPQNVFQRGGSFLAGNLSFSRARVSLEGSTPASAYKEPNFNIPGTPAIVQHEILNNRRHVLTKDAAGSVKLWEITRGVAIEDYGQVSFDEKKEELFEMVIIPAWFTVDTRLGSLSVHLDTPQCFTAEMYSADLNISGKPEDDKEFPSWVLDCILNNRLPPRENAKCSFYLHPCDGSSVQILTQGKLSAPRILRMDKVVNYVIEKLVLDKPIDSVNIDGTYAPGLGGQSQSGSKPWQKLRPSIEILCNNQVLSPDMSLATVRAYIWKKPKDLVLNYRVIQSK